VLQSGELVDEEVRRRARADSDELVVANVPDRLARDGLLQLVLRHRV
jgi:hypothetical protein